jgi:MFS family permease
VYVTVREQIAPGDPSASPKPPRRRHGGVGVARNVVFLGLTSLLTDISSEMVAAILPIYLVLYLGLTPLAFGIVDGLYHGIAALVRLASGYLADRWHRHKDVAILGYGLSALCKPAMLLAGNAWLVLGGIVLLDRTGKGIRTAPRDAMISLSSSAGGLGTAFGVHRAMDTLGALLGPVVAFALLARLPNAFDAVFVVSFCFAVLGLGVLVLLVEHRSGSAAAVRHAGLTLRHVAGLLQAPDFRALVVAGALLALCTISDGFLYLVLQRRAPLPAGAFPLLYVATSLCYFLLAVPVGRLADRIGRGRVLLAGYFLLATTYLFLFRPTLGYVELGAAVFLLGAYYAATDGVLMASASAVLRPEVRTTGLGLITTGTTLSRLFASVLFGAAWTLWGVEVATLVFLAGLLVATSGAAVVLARAGQLAGPDGRAQGGDIDGLGAD